MQRHLVTSHTIPSCLVADSLCHFLLDKLLGESGAKQSSFTNSFIASAICSLETLLEVTVVIPHV